MRNEIFNSRMVRLSVLLACVQVCMAEQADTPASTSDAAIAESSIASLKADLARSRSKRASAVDRRRACKGVARKGTALVEAHSSATNRYAVLELVLESQKRLLEMEASDRNRDALFATCSKLSEAPDEYALIRLEAHMLLSERNLASQEATLEERAEALRELVARYRDTSAEAKSLMMAALIASQLDARDLHHEIVQAMDERYAGDPQMISFRRDNLSLMSLLVKCKGKYTRADGTELFLPADRIGHHCLMVFWSRNKPGFEGYLKQVEEQQNRFPEVFDVYSFNLDELPDAGEQTLRAMGLDWVVMRLPGGRNHESYRAFATRDPIAIVVNGYGYTILSPMGLNRDATVGVQGIPTENFKISDSRVSHDRYLAQLQSLFIGDFLITDPIEPFDPAWPPELKMAGGEHRTSDVEQRTTDTPVPAEVLQGIQRCFIAPPFRYRLNPQEALANYQKAEKLCAEALQNYPQTSNLWIVRNRRIIALLGMWNLVCEPSYLEQAVAEARVSLATELPSGAEVVPQFCLAKQALRGEDPDAASVLADLIEATGGREAPASSLAAASILALDANDRELHEAFRAALLDAPDDGNPVLWPVVAFLRNRYHRFHLLKPNSTRADRMMGTREYIVNHGREPSPERLPDITLKGLDGQDMRFPSDTHDKLTLLLFVEPPTDPEADFPVVLDRNGKPTQNDHIRSVVRDAASLVDTHVNKDVDVILAFLCDDPKRVSVLMEENGWTGQPVIVPGGLKNPLVQRLGILSADRVPNVFLLRRDGSIAWHTSGFSYKSEFGYPFALLLGMKVHIEVCEVEYGYKALAKGDFKEAARIFAGPFLPDSPDRFGWRSPRYHGLALAQMGLQDWDAALDAIDVAIDAHKPSHYRYKGREPSQAKDWRPGMAEIEIKNSCDVFSELWTLKAITLEKLGRQEEANTVRKRASETFNPDGPSPYGDFHEKLTALRKM